MMVRLNLGIVGCGDIAGYLGKISRLVPSVHLSACCDVQLDCLENFSHRFKIPQFYTHYDAMLEKASVEAVYLAVPHHLHYQMILDAISAGKHVLVEKPLTRTLEEGKRLVHSLINEKGGVNYQYRYDKGCYALARAVQSGQLGEINSVRINIPWHRTSAYFENAHWHKSLAQAGGGTLFTQGSHFLDVALWAPGELPVSAMGYTASSPGFNAEVDTLTHGIIETSGGTLISLTSSMVAATQQAVTIEIYGERGSGFYCDLPRPSAKFLGVKVHKQNPPVPW